MEGHQHAASQHGMLAPCQCPHGCSHHAGGQWLKDQAGSRIKLAQGKFFSFSACVDNGSRIKLDQGNLRPFLVCFDFEVKQGAPVGLRPTPQLMDRPAHCDRPVAEQLYSQAEGPTLYQMQSTACLIQVGCQAGGPEQRKDIHNHSIPLPSSGEPII